MLEGALKLIGGHLAGKAVDQLAAKFKTSVIERWSRRRAQAFIETFSELVAEGQDEAGLQSCLDEILQDEQKSAALFDAYRRVTLSASPEIGPRIVAVVTAKLVFEARQASPEEEKILAAAERLSDDELRATKQYFTKHVSKLEETGGTYIDDYNADDTAGVDFWNDIAPWAGKLASVGAIGGYSRLVKHSMDPHSFDSALSMRICVSYYPAVKALADLVAKVDPKEAETGQRP